MTETKNAAALILCAGYSSRMGDFKPLLPIGGVSALGHIVRTLRLAGVSRIYAVTGHNREALSEPLAQLDAEEIYNPGFDAGMFSSVRAGVARLAASETPPEGAFVWPCDCPLCGVETVSALLREGLASGRLSLPVFEGEGGHPLWVPSRLFGEILTHNGDMGLRGVTSRYENETLRVSAPDAGSTGDMDAPKDYERLCEIYAARPKRRVFLVRHGDVDVGPEKLLIGQYEVPLSPIGERRILGTARELRLLGAKPEAVYCSDLGRAVKSAELLSRELGLPEPRTVPELREIDLGDWDGRPVSELREKFPGEYLARGAALFDWRTPGGETFRELRDRAARRLGVILTGTRGDVLAVSHAGTIRVLDSVLEGVWPPRAAVPFGALSLYGLRLRLFG